MITFLSGVLSAVVLSVVVELLTGGVTKTLRRLRLRWTSKGSPELDTTRDGLYMLGEWSPTRQLAPHRLMTIQQSELDRPTQRFVDASVLGRIVENRTQDTGDICFITRFKLDHRESHETQSCRVTLAASSYAEVRAIEEIRTSAPHILLPADRALQENAREYVLAAVPSSVAINVIVVTSDGEMLCAKRSAAVDNGVGMWTVGIFETMKRSERNLPGQPEDFYALGRRALLEELGLNPHDYGDLSVTWVGIYQPLLRGHVVAITRLRITKNEVVNRARQSDSSYEHSHFDWLPLNRATMRSFAGAQTKTGPSVGATLHLYDRDWLEQGRLGVLEAWRFRVVLDD